MKTKKRLIGDWGEEKACQVLKQQGFVIIDRNFSCKLGEIDIIAVKNGIISFTEVKTRNRIDYGLPCQAVDCSKQRRIRNTAEYYMKINKWCVDLQPSFDIFELLILDSGVYYRFLKNAF